MNARSLTGERRELAGMRRSDCGHQTEDAYLRKARRLRWTCLQSTASAIVGDDLSSARVDWTAAWERGLVADEKMIWLHAFA
jgi:hypothetical protein